MIISEQNPSAEMTGISVDEKTGPLKGPVWRIAIPEPSNS